MTNPELPPLPVGPCALSSQSTEASTRAPAWGSAPPAPDQTHAGPEAKSNTARMPVVWDTLPIFRPVAPPACPPSAPSPASRPGSAGRSPGPSMGGFSPNFPLVAASRRRGHSRLSTHALLSMAVGWGLLPAWRWWGHGRGGGERRGKAHLASSRK